MTDESTVAGRRATLRCAFCLKLNRVDMDRAVDRPACGECGRPFLLDRPVKIGGEDLERLVRDAEETVVREYELDEDGETLRQVWTFGEGEGVYGSQLGEAHRLPGGNVLHNYGSGARLREVAPDGTVVWDVTWENGKDRWLGRSTPLEDLYALGP